MSLFTKALEEADEKDNGVTKDLSYEEISTIFEKRQVKQITQTLKDPNIEWGQMDLRYSTALDLTRLRQQKIVIIGVGGIGSWVQKVLLGMGVKHIQLIDFDIVDIHNVGPQNFNMLDIGSEKLEVIQRDAIAYKGIKPTITKAKIRDYAHLHEQMGGEAPDILISAVDNMEIRNKLFWGSLTRESAASGYAGGIFGTVYSALPKLFIDARMSLGAWNVYALPLQIMARTTSLTAEHIQSLPAEGRDITQMIRYTMDTYREDALFQEDEGVEEKCTERAIIFTGMNIASYIAALIADVVNNPRTLTDDLDAFLDTIRPETAFHWVRSFNSTRWEDKTPNAKEYGMIVRANNLTRENMKLRNSKDALFKKYQNGNAFSEALMQILAPKLDPEDLVPGNYVLVNTNLGALSSLGTHPTSGYTYQDILAGKWHCIEAVVPEISEVHVAISLEEVAAVDVADIVVAVPKDAYAESLDHVITKSPLLRKQHISIADFMDIERGDKITLASELTGVMVTDDMQSMRGSTVQVSTNVYSDQAGRNSVEGQTQYLEEMQVSAIRKVTHPDKSVFTDQRVYIDIVDIVQVTKTDGRVLPIPKLDTSYLEKLVPGDLVLLPDGLPATQPDRYSTLSPSGYASVRTYVSEYKNLWVELTNIGKELVICEAYNLGTKAYAFFHLAKEDIVSLRTPQFCLDFMTLSARETAVYRQMIIDRTMPLDEQEAAAVSPKLHAASGPFTGRTRRAHLIDLDSASMSPGVQVGSPVTVSDLEEESTEELTSWNDAADAANAAAPANAAADDDDDWADAIVEDDDDDWADAAG